MNKLLALVLAVGLCGCGDFVDEDGETSIRQVAEGLQTLGVRVGELGEAIERDADVEAVPWRDLMETIPREIDGALPYDSEGDDATDRNGAGISIAHREYDFDGNDVFVGVADLGALRSGVMLALRWVAPILMRRDFDGHVEELRIDGHPAIRLEAEEHEGHLVALLVGSRFAVIAGAEGRRNDDFVREALGSIDYDRLEDLVDYGKR